MKIKVEKDERTKRQIEATRSKEKEQQAQRMKRDEEQKRQKRQWFEDQSGQKIKMLELQLAEERQKREALERQWMDAQYDDTWEEKDGWTQWYSEEEVEVTQEETSRDSSY